MSDVGISKASAMKQHLQSIVPWCVIEDYSEMFLMKEADRLLAGSPDFVLDCIDDVNTKAELLAYCLQHHLPVFTSMGAGGKADPTKLRIAPLSECINDPLAQKIKWKLKKHGVTADQVMSVFSVEKPIAELLPLDEEQKNAPQDFGAVDYLRIRVIPVLGTSPSIFGQAMASYTLCSLAGKMYDPEGCERMSKSLKHKLRQVFKNNEKERFQVPVEQSEGIFDDDDLEFLVQQVWKSRCAITQKRFGGHLMLTLTRWDPNQPPSAYNCVLMMQTEAKALHEHGQSYFASRIQAKINERLAWAKRVLAEDIDSFHYGPAELYWNEAFQNYSVHKGTDSHCNRTSHNASSSMIVTMTATVTSFAAGFFCHWIVNLS
jgi:tRNA A37 threonylcarbamoyladenosine dehydratase